MLPILACIHLIACGPGCKCASTTCAGSVATSADLLVCKSCKQGEGCQQRCVPKASRGAAWRSLEHGSACAASPAMCLACFATSALAKIAQPTPVSITPAARVAPVSALAGGAVQQGRKRVEEQSALVPYVRLLACWRGKAVKSTARTAMQVHSRVAPRYQLTYLLGSPCLTDVAVLTFPEVQESAAHLFREAEMASKAACASPSVMRRSLTADGPTHRMQRAVQLSMLALEPSIVSNIGSTTVKNCVASSCQCFSSERVESLCMHISAGTDSRTAATSTTELCSACEFEASIIYLTAYAHTRGCFYAAVLSKLPQRRVWLNSKFSAR